MFVLLTADTQMVARTRKVALIRHFVNAIIEVVQDCHSDTTGVFCSASLHYTTVRFGSDSQ